MGKKKQAEIVSQQEQLPEPEPQLEPVIEDTEAIQRAEEDHRFLLAAAESLVFASLEPLSEDQFIAALGQKHRGKLDGIVQELNREYEREGRAFEILKVARGYQFFTRPDFSGLLRRVYAERAKSRVSRAALETLAVVAYRGPVTRAEIDEIRGVDSGGVLRTLLERRLIEVQGRAQVLGRPLLYQTTAEFLKHFGLSDLSDLPRDSELSREWGQLRASEQAAPEEPLAMEGFAVDPDAVPEDATNGHKEIALADPSAEANKDIEP
jgi:segregation and condensation protein B